MVHEVECCNSPLGRNSGANACLEHMAPVKKLLERTEYNCYHLIDDNTVFCTICDKQINLRDNGRENSSLRDNKRTKKHTKKAKRSSGVTPSVVETIGKKKITLTTV